MAFSPRVRSSQFLGDGFRLGIRLRQDDCFGAAGDARHQGKISAVAAHHFQ
jgi:hypothetical protein